MNPGLLRSRCRLLRSVNKRDESGQPVKEWVQVAEFRARRMSVRGESNEPKINDQEREKIKATFCRRARHAEIVKRGDRLAEQYARGVEERIWEISATIPVTGGQYVDLLCEVVE